MATANASSKGKTLGSFLGNKEGKELRENAQYCSLCDSDAEYYCNTCNSYLCNDCKGSHKRQRATKTHDVVHISNAAPSDTPPNFFCQIHQGVAVKHFCKKCEVVVCATCVKGKHTSHELLTLTDANTEIKNMCLEKVKLLQEPLSKMKSEKQLLEKQKSANNRFSEAERELARRKDHLNSLINEIFSQEAKKVQSLKNDIETNISQLSPCLDTEIKTCESLLTPIMSLVLKENVHDILKCSQNIDNELGNANDILSKLDTIKHSSNFTLNIRDKLNSNVEHEIRNYLTIDSRMRQATGLKRVNRTQVDTHFTLSSNICSEKFYVQRGLDIMQMAFDRNGDASVSPLAKQLPARGKNGYGFSILTISASHHIVITESGINVYHENDAVKFAAHTPDGYTPDNLGFISDHEFVTLCAKQKKIRYHNSKTLDVLGTYDLDVPMPNVDIFDTFVLLTYDRSVILLAKDDNQTKLIKFSKKGKFIEVVSIRDEFFKFSLITTIMHNHHIICLQKHGSAYSFTLQGEHSCIGQIDNDVEYVWGAGTDGTHLYVSYQKDFKSRFVAKFEFLYD